ncbi:MAG TPA: cytochrome c [Kofleriaceae bacterium]|nr:cytochrome c [Kofleriaceae bacterium]
MRMLLALLLIAACGKNDEPPPETTGAPNAKQESGPGTRRGAGPANATEQAHKMFETVCAMCHGTDGTGRGPAAENLNPKPRNYTDPAWQASVTDDEIRKTILLGGQATGKSASMPGQPQLKDQPEVLDGLVQIIRGFKQGDAPAAGSGAGSAAK